MTLIPTFRQDMYQIRVTCYQRFFLLVTPSLYLFFPIKGVIDTIALFVVNKFHRQSLGSVMCAKTILMFPEAPLQIPGTARIVASVGAFKDIHERHCRLLPSTPLREQVTVDGYAKVRRLSRIARWLSEVEANYFSQQLILKENDSFP